jgi:hypothetical protein
MPKERFDANLILRRLTHFIPNHILPPQGCF